MVEPKTLAQQAVFATRGVSAHLWQESSSHSHLILGLLLVCWLWQLCLLNLQAHSMSGEHESCTCW